MNRKITKRQFSLFLFSLLAITLTLFAFNTRQRKDTIADQDKEIIEAVRRVLSVAHFQPKTIDSSFSEKMYRNYFHQLNQRSLIRSFFKPEDMALFDVHKKNIADDFKETNLDFFHATIDTLYNRLNEQEKLSKLILSKPLDYSKKDFYTIRLDSEKRKTEESWKELLERQYKYNILDKVRELKKEDQEKRKKDANYAVRDFKTLEEASRIEITQYAERFFRVLKKRKKQDWFSIYVNAFTTVYDPHTNYFSPRQEKSFNISISGKFEGIGAVLEDKKIHPTISSLLVGSPSWKQGELEVGDQITNVAQGLNEKPVSLAGMSLDDAVELIRGKKGTTVVLWVKKKNGSNKKIAIVRDEIELEETYAKSTLVKDANGKLFGLIYLPEFYFDQNNKKGRNAADDIEKEIEKLKKENVQGLILDLRNNGGGSLFSAVKIASFFIGNGPVVQVKRNNGKKDILNESFGSIKWNKPLTILVNNFSASASEILAGAIQDYKRGVVIGSDQTFGKGTVQMLIPFDQYFGKKYLGSLKITTQKFYRINGESTQLKGVSSDIVVYPKRSADKKTQELDGENALPWDTITSTRHKPYKKSIDLSYIKAQSNERLKKSSYMNLLNQYTHWLDRNWPSYKVPLYIPEFFNDLNQKEEEGKVFKALDDYNNNLVFTPLLIEKQKEKNDTTSIAKRDRWYKNLKKDFAIEEAVNVLKDLEKTTK